MRNYLCMLNPKPEKDVMVSPQVITLACESCGTAQALAEKAARELSAKTRMSWTASSVVIL